MGFDLGLEFDLEFTRSNMEFAISQSEVIQGSGVRIYKIVTEVTSDVGVPSSLLPCDIIRERPLNLITHSLPILYTVMPMKLLVMGLGHP